MPLGYSSFGIALFMWIIGGVLANIFFGSEKKDKKESSSIEPNQYIQKTPRFLFCPSCGFGLDDDTIFCPECGVAIEKPVK